MSVGVLERPATGSAPEPTTGGVPARRAMIRWAWRLFKREWRQQLLILLLVIVAVAAVVVGAAVAVNTPPPANAGYGTADDLATFTSSRAKQSHLSICIRWTPRSPRWSTASARSRSSRTRPSTSPAAPRPTNFGPRTRTAPTAGPCSSCSPGTTRPGRTRSPSPLGWRPSSTSGWATPGPKAARRSSGIVQNPQSLLDEFALVPPGQVTHPTAVDVLFDAPGVDPGRIGSNVSTPGSLNNNPINPETIVLALATVGMLLIALVSVGGFTVLAQRRLRALGMLESMGATDRNVRLVLRANGVIVGAVGAVVGFALGLVAWLAYRPHNEQSAHHLIPMFALPWTVIVVAMVLAVVATFFAAGHPARAITRVPVVSALAGRPAPPRQIHRSFVPGVIALVIGFFMFSLSGAAGTAAA